MSLSQLYQDSLSLLEQLITENGILASAENEDNYNRVWARDSVVCGIAGIIAENEKLVAGLKSSLLTLAKHQHETGMIPSNVAAQSGDVSYGSLVGRIDTNTWFIVGCCLYQQYSEDASFWKQIKPHIEKCLGFLKASEFNGKGWIYTPLSGNWADEYPVHGYTLYDNTLRIWGERLFLKIEGKSTLNLDKLAEKTFTNFWPSQNASEALLYQKNAFQKALKDNPKHFTAFILPGKYDQRFDAAGNALALLQFSLNELQKQQLTNFIDQLSEEISKPCIPAFWPIINEDSEDYFLLKGNYSYDFKNEAGAFHNGGIWPVWMGLFCLGLSNNGLIEVSKKITEQFMAHINTLPNWDFQEFLNAKTLQLGGKNKMGYTASGIVFMYEALKNSPNFSAILSK